MALKASFVWQNPDSTADLNDRTRQLVQRGVYFGGNVVPGTGLTVVLSPFIAMSFDGMTVTESASQILTVTDGQVNVVVTRARYNPFGTPATPTLIHQVLEESAYNADAEKDYLIVHTKVDIPALAVSVAAGDIDFTEADHVDPVDRKIFRGDVANAAALPTPTSPTNRTGDFYYVTADNTFYVWDGSAWNALSTGSFNSEVSHMNDTLVQAEIRRNTEGSGVIAGDRLPSGIGVGDYSSFREILITDTPSVADQIALQSFTAYVNGFYVQVHSQNVALPVKPGVGTRFDLIFLEVWREQVVSPQTYAYERNPDGALTYDIDEIDTQGAELLWLNGLAGNNFNLPEIEARDHDWVVTKWRLGVAENVPIDCLHQPGDNTVASVATNIDASAFSAPAGTGIDNRIWMASSATTPIDGKSWAIPLIAIRRDAAENAGISDAVKQFRSNIRHVFHVYPVADISKAARATLTTISRKEPGGYLTASGKHPSDKPSGFLNNVREFPIQAGVGANTIKFFDAPLNIRIRGMEDWIPAAIGTEFDLLAPPGAGYARVLVYLKMNIILYADNLGYHSSIHFPYFPSQVGIPMDNMGWKQGFVSYNVVVSNLGAVGTLLDVDDAMTAEGWSRGDASQPSASGKEFEDGGLWSKTITLTEDDRIHPHLAEWAIPICLVHRRNTTAWNFNTNPNGTTASRPDDRTDATVIHPDDIIDLRMLADTDIDLNGLLEESVDKLLKGELRTRMANKGKGTGTGGAVAGSRILQADQVTSTVPGAAYDLPVADTHRRIWSDAREFQTVARSFPMNADFSDDLITFNFTTGAISIKSPPGKAHLVRHMPAVFYADADTAGTYLEFKGPPLWATRTEGESGIVPYPVPVRAKQYDTSTRVISDLFGSQYEDFTVAATDTYGRATQMDATIPGAPFGANDQAILSWWVHYDRSLTAPYNSNWGLAEVPDEVWKATKAQHSGSPVDLHVGTIYTAVRKTLAGASFVDFTASDVSAASGVPGATVTMVGFGNIDYDTTAPTITSTTMNDARDTLTLNFLAPFSGDVEAQIFFYTDEVNEWVEVGRGGKSVRALFSWHEQNIDNVSEADDPAVIDLGNDVWQNIEASGKIFATDTQSTPILWTRNAPATDWTQQVLFNVTDGLGYANSNMMEAFIDASVRFTHQFSLTIFPKQSAPSSGINDDIIIHYAYTPYQGLSSDGGAAAIPATAIPLLKKMLHGKVEENTDFYATQSGAASFHGGIDSFNGIPARPTVFQPTIGSSNAVGRFAEYNSTDLVKRNFRGMRDLIFEREGRAVLNAAAVLRLPFPQSSAMLFSSYHDGVMDFDLDPGREGSSAGFFSYAPGYPGGATLPPGHTKLQYDQFVNGLSRLSVRGEAKQQSESHFIPAANMSGAESAVSSFTLNVNGTWTIAGGLGPFGGFFRGNVGNVKRHILGRSLTRADIDIPPPSGGSSAGIGIGVFDIVDGGHATLNPSLAISPPAASLLVQGSDVLLSSIKTITKGTTEEVFIVTCPGSVLSSLQGSFTDRLYPTIQLHFLSQNGSVDNTLYDTVVTIDSERSLTAQGGSETALNADLIRLPLGSGHSESLQDSGFHIHGKTSLRGMEIKYPDNWGASTITTLESLIVEADHSRRGLYLGTNTRRHNMSTFVPGSGTHLRYVLDKQNLLIDVDDDQPLPFPYMPGDPVFASTNKFFTTFDHGGPVAYVFMGLMINPADDDFRSRAVIQIAGGPTGGDISAQQTGSYQSTDLHGTAIDAFWPLYRPLIKSRK